jgi:hypothetical protein
VLHSGKRNGFSKHFGRGAEHAFGISSVDGDEWGDVFSRKIPIEIPCWKLDWGNGGTPIGSLGVQLEDVTQLLGDCKLHFLLIDSELLLFFNFPLEHCLLFLFLNMIEIFMCFSKIME